MADLMGRLRAWWMQARAQMRAAYRRGRVDGQVALMKREKGWLGVYGLLRQSETRNSKIETRSAKTRQ